MKIEGSHLKPISETGHRQRSPSKCMIKKLIRVDPYGTLFFLGCLSSVSEITSITRLRFILNDSKREVIWMEKRTFFFYYDILVLCLKYISSFFLLQEYRQNVKWSVYPSRFSESCNFRYLLILHLPAFWLHFKTIRKEFGTKLSQLCSNPVIFSSLWKRVWERHSSFLS